jgi:Lrp/AsnC family transcriptional regulator
VKRTSLDDIDRRILRCLQEDASMRLELIAERAGLSASPCWRRIQKLEAAGVIKKQVVLLDPEKLNVGTTVFVSVRTNQHSADWSARFCRAVSQIPEVVEFYRMSGDIDYLFRVVVPDIAAYDRVYKRLIEAVEVHDVSSNFAMECIKQTTALPLDYATG